MKIEFIDPPKPQFINPPPKRKYSQREKDDAMLGVIKILLRHREERLKKEAEDKTK